MKGIETLVLLLELLEVFLSQDLPRDEGD